jgi:hypothetical protein
MKRDEFGVRRQSAAATALWMVALMSEPPAVAGGPSDLSSLLTVRLRPARYRRRF